MADATVGLSVSYVSFALAPSSPAPGSISGSYPFVKVSDMNSANTVRIQDANNWRISKTMSGN